MTLEQGGESLQRARLLTRAEDPADLSAKAPALASQDAKGAPRRRRETRFRPAGGPGDSATHGPHRREANNDAAKESNLPSRGLPGPASFEDRMGHQARAAPPMILRA